MTTEITTLGLAVDSSQVTTAGAALDKFAAAGKSAEQAATGVEKAARSVGGATPSLNGAAAAMARAGKEAQALQKSQERARYQTLQLSNQLQDFFVQVQAGGSPLTALIQQGSQLTSVYGGVGPAIKGIAGIFSVVRVAAGGAAAALGAFAFAAIEGNNQSKALERALMATGNAAGITQGQFERLAASIADSTKSAVGETRDTLQTLVASGRFSGEALTSTARAAQLFQKATGETSADVVKDFLSMTNGVAKWAEQTNRSYNFLTAEQLKYIRTLEDQGDQQRAIAVTMDALSQRVGGAAQNVGILEGAWNGVKRAASEAIDAMLRIGRTRTAEDQVDSIAAQIKALDERRSTNPALAARRREVLVKELEAAQAVAAAAQKAVVADAERNKVNQAGIAFDKLKEASLSKQEKMAKELADANALADKAGIASAEREKVLASIREKYADKGAVSKALTEANQVRKATLTSDIEDIKQALRGEAEAFKNAESIMEAARAAGTLDDKTYYASKLAFIRLNEEAQVAALEKENERLKAEKVTGADRINNLREIAKNEAEIERVRADAVAKSQVLATQQTAALQSQTQAYNEARIAAEQYLATLQRQNQRELDAFGMGDQARDRVAGRNQIDDRYQEQRNRLAEDLRRGQLGPTGSAEAKARYDAELALIDEFNGKALQSYEERIAKQRQLEGDASLGASRAIENYLDNSRNVAKQTEDLYTRTFSSIEDAIVQFATTGKLNFKSFADSVIAELIRIQVKAAVLRATQAAQGGGGIFDIFKAFVSIGSGVAGLGAAGAGSLGTNYSLPTSGVKFGPPRANGGPVFPNTIHPVNERGPELLTMGGRQYLMMGAQGGKVTPNSELGGMGGGINIINQTAGRVDKATWVPMPDGERALLIQQAADAAERRITNSLSNPNSRMSRSQQRNFKTERNR